MQVMLIVSLPGVCVAESAPDRPEKLSAAQIQSIQQAGSALLTARARAVEVPENQQLRNDLQALKQTLDVLSRPMVVGGDIQVQSKGDAPVATPPQAAMMAQARRAADKQRARDAMVQVRQRHDLLRRKPQGRGAVPLSGTRTVLAEKLNSLQTDLDDALAKPDADMQAACKLLLERIEPRRLMIARPLDDQPTLSTRTTHRRQGITE